MTPSDADSPVQAACKSFVQPEREHASILPGVSMLTSHKQLTTGRSISASQEMQVQKACSSFCGGSVFTRLWSANESKGF